MPRRLLTFALAPFLLTAALSAAGRHREASETAAKFRAQYPGYRTQALGQLWVSRSGSAAYRAQIQPLFEKMRGLGLAN